MNILSNSTPFSLFQNASRTRVQIWGSEMMGKISMKAQSFLKSLYVLVAPFILSMAYCSMRGKICQYCTKYSFIKPPKLNFFLFQLTKKIRQQMCGRKGKKINIIRDSQRLNLTEKMPHKYNIDTDHLKCNFCTQWFKCSQHYANIQRYSLKACTNCIQNFNFSIVHPHTYKLYKVFLFDTNIHIRKGSSQMGQHFGFQLELVQQDIKDSISRYFQGKIKQIISDMDSCTARVDQSVGAIVKELAKCDENCSEMGDSKKNEITGKINRLKQRTLEYWIGNKEEMPPLKPKLSKTMSTNQLSRKSSASNLEKENTDYQNSTKKQGWGKSIRYKIGIRPPQEGKNSMKSSVCLDYKPRNEPARDPFSSLMNSRKKSQKRLALSNMTSSVTNIPHQERDIHQITKMLQEAKKHNTYLPLEIYPQTSVINKNESKRTHADSIIDMREKTLKGGQLLELIGHDISKINFQCFLQSLGQQPQAKIVRIIKAGMTDYQFDSLLRFIARHPGVQTLIVTNNKLTEISLNALKTFRMLNGEGQLSHVYIGGNRIGRQHAVGVARQLEGLGVEIFL